MTSDGSVVNKANVSIVCDLSYTVNSSDENDDDEYLLSAVPNVVALGNEDSIAVASAFHPSQIWAIVRIRGSPVASVSA